MLFLLLICLLSAYFIDLIIECRRVEGKSPHYKIQNEMLAQGPSFYYPEPPSAFSTPALKLFITTSCCVSLLTHNFLE
jgi:hypothetical protein